MIGFPNPEAAALADEYHGVLNQSLGRIGVAPGLKDTATDKLIERAGDVIAEQRSFLERIEATAKTVVQLFLPAVIGARAAAEDIALTQGEFTPQDHESLARVGTGLQEIQEYLVPFVRQEDADLPADMPPLGISTAARLKNVSWTGGEGYAAGFYNAHAMIEPVASTFQFNETYDVPVLVDPTMYTLAEFSALPEESADGFAQQVADTWQSIIESERDHPSFTGEPLVVRAVGVLPLPPVGPAPEGTRDFEIDFVPFIKKSPSDTASKVRRAYDARLLVSGNENVGTNYLKFESSGRNRVEVRADNAGRESALTVTRAKVIEDKPAETFEDLSLTPRSQGAIALYLAPHVVENTPVVSQAASSSVSMATTRTPKLLGGAHVSVAPGSAWLSERRAEGFTSRVAPELIGRPIIVSMQLLTFEAQIA